MFRLDKSSWEPDYEDFISNTLPLLKQHGKNIGEKSKDNKNCQNIIKYYDMIHRSFDPLFHKLLKDELSEYLLSNFYITQYQHLVEKMGSDPQGDLTEKACLQELRELEEREFLCGAYWVIDHLYPECQVLLNELAIAKNREEFLSVLKYHIKENNEPRL
jgi:hypothetical protein